MKKLLLLLFVPLLAFDYNTSMKVIPIASSAKPARGVEYCDLNYNTTFYRVSDAVVDTNTNQANLVYSRFSPLSYDGQYLFLQSAKGWNDGLIYNAQTYAFIERLPDKTTIDGNVNQNFVTMEGAECRWRRDSTNPHQFYYVGYATSRAMQLLCYDVDKNTAVLVHDFSKEFPTQDKIGNDVEGDSSRDSRYWAFMVFDAYNGSSFPLHAIVTYDRITDKIIGTMDLAKYKSLGGKYNYLPRPNMVDMAPSGKKMVMLMPRCWGTESYGERPQDINGNFDSPHSWDLDFMNPIKVAADQTHSGWAYDYSGNECFISQNNRDDHIQATNVMTGTSFYMLKDGTTFNPSWNNGYHFVRMPSSDVVKGWMGMVVYTDAIQPVDWEDNEILFVEMVNMDKQTPKVWRAGSLMNLHTDYYSEGIVAVDDNGTDLWFNSNWLGGTANETYHMVLPNNWWNDLSGTTPPEPPIPPIPPSKKVPFIIGNY